MVGRYRMAELAQGRVSRSMGETLAIVDALRDYAFLTLDAEGRVLSWNAGAREITGRTGDEMLGRSVAVLYDSEDRAARTPQQLLERAATEGRAEDERWRVRKDGSRYFADVVITALRDPSGALRGFVEIARDVTQRRRADEALRSSADRIRKLVESVKDYAIFIVDPQGCIQSWNSGATEMKGWTAEEVVGKHMSMFYPPGREARADADALLRAAAEQGRVEHEGFRVRKDGSRFWADVILSRIDGEHGELLGFVKVTRDLTERRAVEQALRASEERMRLMIESVKDYAIFMLDPEGRVATWNPGAERFSGYPAHEVIGRYYEIFVPEEDRAVGKPARELEIAAREGRYEEEGWRVRRDGSRYWASVVMSAVRDPSGGLLGFTKVLRDHTEHRQTTRRLEMRARQQAAIAELGMVALRERDPSAVAAAVVETVRNVLDVELAGLIELEGDELVLSTGVGWREGAIGARAPFDVSVLSGRAVALREPVVVADYETRQVVLSDFARQHGARSGVAVVIPARDPGAVPFGVLVALRTVPHESAREDVSFLQGAANIIAASVARRADEEARRDAERAAFVERSRSEHAQQALQERDDFISVAAHELRTPLNALQLNVQSLELLLAREPRSRAHSRVEAALRQTRRLGQLIERLLDVSRIAAGSLDLVPEQVDLLETVRDVLETLGDSARRAGSSIALTVNCADSVGVWDRGRLEQVFVNLLSNAIKYGNGGAIEVRVDGDEDRVRIEVEDRGIGIALEDLQRVFGRFQRAAPAQHFAGMGLGLYIASQIVEAHGGTLGASSRLGEGSTFVVELPRRVSRGTGAA